jgi:hypothetical protein
MKKSINKNVKYLVVRQASLHRNRLAQQPDLVVSGKRTVLSVEPCIVISLIRRCVSLQLDQRREATEILRVLYSALKHCSFLRRLQLIRATVPILKFTDHIR